MCDDGDFENLEILYPESAQFFVFKSYTKYAIISITGKETRTSP